MSWSRPLPSPHLLLLQIVSLKSTWHLNGTRVARVASCSDSSVLGSGALWQVTLTTDLASSSPLCRTHIARLVEGVALPDECNAGTTPDLTKSPATALVSTRPVSAPLRHAKRAPNRSTLSTFCKNSPPDVTRRGSFMWSWWGLEVAHLSRHLFFGNNRSIMKCFC